MNRSFSPFLFVQTIFVTTTIVTTIIVITINTLRPIYGITHARMRFLSSFCHQNTIFVHSQKKSSIHKETLDTKTESDVKLHQISTTQKQKLNKYENIQIHNRTKWL